jgi:hypothetical protein
MSRASNLTIFGWSACKRADPRVSVSRQTAPHETEFMSRRSRHHRVPVNSPSCVGDLRQCKSRKDSIYEPQDHFLDDSRCDGGHRR